jgi:hypothetical protein
MESVVLAPGGSSNFETESFGISARIWAIVRRGGSAAFSTATG